MNQWVVVVGGTNMDVVARTSAPLVPATSNPGTPDLARRRRAQHRREPRPARRTGAPGVGGRRRPVRRRAAAGDRRVRRRRGRRTPGAGPTGTYTAVLDDRGELVVAVSDMATVDALELDTLHLADAALVVVDGNLAAAQVARAFAAATRRACRSSSTRSACAKAARSAELVARPLPGHAQRRRAGRAHRAPGRPTGATRVADLHDRGVELVWVRGGAAARWSAAREHDPCTCPPCPPTVVDVTGAGDAMLAAWSPRVLARRRRPSRRRGVRPRAPPPLTVASAHTVRPDLADGS